MIQHIRPLEGLNDVKSKNPKKKRPKTNCMNISDISYIAKEKYRLEEQP